MKSFTGLLCLICLSHCTNQPPSNSQGWEGTESQNPGPIRMRTETLSTTTVRPWNARVQGNWVECTPCQETERASGWWQTRRILVQGAEMSQILDLFEDANCRQASLQFVMQRTLMEPEQGLLLHTLETQSSERSLEVKKADLLPLLNQGDICQLRDFTLQGPKALNQACGKQGTLSLELKLSKNMTLQLTDEPSYISLIQPPQQVDTLFFAVHRGRAPGEEEWPLLERITGAKVSLPGGSTWLKFQRLDL